ncbi:MAG: GNAT family N-acetyltransferase [Clostridiales bacterium]|nr:GNAT family N-acetyltransferase [Clostridiales bacterium]
MNSDNKKLRLEPVNMDNFYSLGKLKVRRNQQNFVAPNVWSLATAYIATISGGYPQPFGIYLGDKPIGFLMFGYYPSLEYAKKYADEGEETPYFMIEKKYQGRGYGKEAMQLALDYVRTFPVGEAKYCWLSYEPENDVARNLYRSFGFKELEKLPEGWDEIPAVMEL